MLVTDSFEDFVASESRFSGISNSNVLMLATCGSKCSFCCCKIVAAGASTRSNDDALVWRGLSFVSCDGSLPGIARVDSLAGVLENMVEVLSGSNVNGYGISNPLSCARTGDRIGRGGAPTEVRSNGNG